VVSKFDIAKGVATSKALVVDTGGATIVGRGKIMLGSEKLDMYLDPRAKDTNLVKLAIPMTVGGTLASPSIAPDPAAVAKGATGAVVETVKGGGAVGAVAGLVTGTKSGGETTTGTTGCGTVAEAAPTASTGGAAQKPTQLDAPANQPKQKTKEGVGDVLKGLVPN
jgi:hypothetical protein